MKINNKWALALVPLVLAGCKDDIEQPRGPVAESGDDVRFMISNNLQSRTVYAEPWAEKDIQAIYWGNYVTEDEYVNIYCPDNPERGFARYKITPKAETEQDRNHASAIVKMDEIGVQWGEKKPYTFYSFYPADKAEIIDNSNPSSSTILATVETGQSPRVYKQRYNNSEGNFSDLASFKAYNNANYPLDASGKGTVTGDPNTIFGMPDMRAAVMVAKSERTVDQYGEDVPLLYNVLADVFDVTINGPVTPNSLGGNAANGDDIPLDFIKIQGVTIEAVDLTKTVSGAAPDPKNPGDYQTADDLPITGQFELNMADGTINKESISGNATVQMQLSMTEKDDKGNDAVYYPTLYVRSGSTLPVNDKAIDHLRVRAFLIPGQITTQNMNRLRIHLQTDCGDFYQMLENDGNFQGGKGEIYPVKLGYFKVPGASFDLKRWIGQLNPNIYLSELSIPGAWHAANSDYQGNVTMQDLYNNGIRAFEVHTEAGTTKMKVGGDMVNDLFDSSTATEFFDAQFNSTSATTRTFTPSGDEPTNPTDEETQGAFGSGWSVNGTRYYGRRTVTVKGTVSYSENYEYYKAPRFWLPLKRTSGDTSTLLSDAIMSLAQNMNEDGLMVVEMGMNSAPSSMTIDCTRRVTESKTYSVTAEIQAYQYATRSGYIGNYTYTWVNVFEPTEAAWNAIDFTGVEPVESTQEVSGSSTVNINKGQIWSIAVRSCLERLKGQINPKTNKEYVYSGTLNRFTTIGDVQGQVIIKVNTNVINSDNGDNEDVTYWGTETPALFSRWIDGSGKEPLTINLKWKSPIEPYSGKDAAGKEIPDQSEDALRWCFTELDNLSGYNTTVQDRKNAIVAMNEAAAANYKGGLHRTFYETSLGGYTNGSATADNCKDLAKQLNTYALTRITNPTRQAVPLGFVFMNYAIVPSDGTESDYNSAALIRAIINNNRAFLLNRADANESKPAAGDNTNSYFNNNNQNPLK